VTAWALLGSHDWNSLMTRRAGHYEPGIFDMSGGRPRATALALALRSLSEGEHDKSHPAASGPGWWGREGKLLYGHAAPARPSASARRPRRALLIAGASGNLGKAFAQICERRGLEYTLCSRAQLDICCPQNIEAMLDSVRPWALVNAAGYVRVDDAERERVRCHRENFEGAARLATACERRDVRLVTFSSDLVFDGQSLSPYIESSPVAPLNTYGRSKALAEHSVLLSNPEALVIRTSSFFGPWHEHDFLPAVLRALRCGRRFEAMDDVVVSHTYVPDLVNACIDLLIDSEKGIWHLANQGAMSWLDFARLGARLADLDERMLVGRPCGHFSLPARRPAFSALATQRGLILPRVEEAVERFCAESA
jgi:dTDP-4-dehydrorhamnose reductase